MPRYQHASYGGQTITLQNKHLRLDMHKRLTGWGWGEVFTPAASSWPSSTTWASCCCRDQEIPMRLEAAEAKQSAGEFGERLTFTVESLLIKEKLKGTSFEKWINYPLTEHAMIGEVTVRWR